MKNFLFTVSTILTSILCSSCIAPSYMETTVSDEESELVVRYGTPYYYGGTVAYYMYNGGYFYPYSYNNMQRFHRYSRPLPPRKSYRQAPKPRNHGEMLRPPAQPRKDTPARNSRPSRGAGRR
jgi:hypothetical protein